MKSTDRRMTDEIRLTRLSFSEDWGVTHTRTGTLLFAGSRNDCLTYMLPHEAIEDAVCLLTALLDPAVERIDWREAEDVLGSLTDILNEGA